MGMQTAQAAQPISQQQPTQPIPQNGMTQGKTGGTITMPSQTGQPVMGQPNQYSNTTGQAAYNQPQASQQMPQVGQQMPQVGKGKGA